VRSEDRFGTDFIGLDWIAFYADRSLFVMANAYGSIRIGSTKTNANFAY